MTQIDKATRHGYTGHEHLDNLTLIHMNGRVYDPVLGRFLSADPFVPASLGSQGLNRYSYVGNRPLSLTDPSGFEQPPTGTRIRQLRNGDRILAELHQLASESERNCAEIYATMMGITDRTVRSFAHDFAPPGGGAAGGKSGGRDGVAGAGDPRRQE